jgi:hypothetical protein
MVSKFNNIMININKVIGNRSTFFSGGLRDLMDEFSQSVPVPICKRSIQRRLSNLWLSQENCCEKTDNFVENRKNRDTRAPPIRHPYSPKHSVFHLSSAFHHTYPREFFPS